MGRKREKSELIVEKYSVKWLTPWADCTAHLNEGGEAFTIGTSIVPCPVFEDDEWRRFCAAVNEKMKNLKEKDE